MKVIIKGQCEYCGQVYSGKQEIDKDGKYACECGKKSQNWNTQ